MYFFLKEPNANKDTPIILIFYVRQEGKYFKYSTGKTIHPKDWNFESRMPLLKRGAGGVQARHLTSFLTNYVDHLQELLRDLESDGGNITRNYLKTGFDTKFKPARTKVPQNSNTQNVIVADVINDFIRSKQRSGGVTIPWVHKYENLRNKILLFGLYKGRAVQFEHIDPDWMDEYAGFLRKLPEVLQTNIKFRNAALRLRKEVVMKFPKHPINDNTLSRHFGFLNAFLNWSSRKYHSLNLDQLHNPAKTYQADDVHLTGPEVRELEGLVLPRKSLERVRDLFLIGVYSGQRYSDYSVFEKADRQGEMIIKRSEKTEDECYIPLHSRLKALLDKYRWKLPVIAGQNFNPHIQEVCQLAGIDYKVKETIYIGSEKKVHYRPKYEMITSHTARRTFITLSAERGMPDHIIMKITGIKDPKTLQKYKKTSQHSVVDAMMKHWD